MTEVASMDRELCAIRAIVGSLSELDRAEVDRVMTYLIDRWRTNRTAGNPFEMPAPAPTPTPLGEYSSATGGRDAAW